MENKDETLEATSTTTTASYSSSSLLQQPQKMSLSTEDKDDIYLSHRYRLSLPSSPSQSNFRVLALLFFEQHEEEENEAGSKSLMKMLPPWVPQKVTTTTITTTNNNNNDDGRETKKISYERTYIVGTNDEPGYMGGAICAERAAMVQLRWISSFTIKKLVIATDSTVPISPGMLCREFLAGHSQSVPWDLPIISTGCICTECGIKNDELFLSHHQNQQRPLCNNGQSDHAIPILQTTLRELYPYPSPYTRLDSEQSTRLGKAWCDYQQQLEENNEQADVLSSNKENESSSPPFKIEKETATRLLELAILEAKTHVLPDIHPIQFGSAALLHDGTILTSHQICGLEYGCTIDAISQLASQLKELNDNNDSNNNQQIVVKCIVQADQYGIAHGPFAPARSFLSEHGYNDCLILLHDIMSVNNNNDEDEDGVWNFDLWKLRQVQVSELAPTAPDWTTTVEK